MGLPPSAMFSENDVETVDALSQLSRCASACVWLRCLDGSLQTQPTSYAIDVRRLMRRLPLPEYSLFSKLDTTCRLFDEVEITKCQPTDELVCDPIRTNLTN